MVGIAPVMVIAMGMERSGKCKHAVFFFIMEHFKYIQIERQWHNGLPGYSLPCFHNQQPMVHLKYIINIFHPKCFSTSQNRDSGNLLTSYYLMSVKKAELYDHKYIQFAGALFV